MKFPSMRWNTLAGVGSVSALAGIGGSVVTVLLVVSMIWALVMLALRRFPPRYQRSDWLIGGPALLFVLTTVASALLAWTPGVAANRELFAHLVALLPFALFTLVLPRLRTVEPSKIVDIFVIGCALCGILALPFALAQAFWVGMRAEGGAGNAIPFGMICAFFGSLSLLNVGGEGRMREALGWLGFLASAVCVLLSESRGVLPIPGIALVLFLALYPEQRARFRNWKAVAVALVAASVILIVAYDRLGRLWLLFTSIFGLVPGAQDQSLNLRVRMWEHALQLIADSPWFGHGLQNRDALIAEIGMNYTHFHNGFLTALVDSGFIGLVAIVLLILAPIANVVANPAKVRWRTRFFVAIMIAVSCIFGGMTNFIFLHDIYDSVFLWSALIVAMPLAYADEESQQRSDGAHGT